MLYRITRRFNKKNLILLFTTLVICFILLEIFARLFLVEAGYGYPVDMFIPDDKLAFKLNPNFNDYFSGEMFKDIPIKINSDGLRDYEGVLNNKIILGVGDSVTFGAGTSLEDTYLALLEDRLEEYDVVKAGVPSYEFEQYLEYIKSKGFAYKPELIIIGFVLNDINQVKKEEIQDYMFRERKIRDILKKSCRFCGFVWKSTRSIISSFKDEDYYDVYAEYLKEKWTGPEWDLLKRNILELKELCELRDVRLLFVIFPFKDQLVNGDTLQQERLIRLLEEEGIEYIDLYSYLDENSYLVNDDVHLNLKGNTEVSKVLSNYIKEHN